MNMSLNLIFLLLCCGGGLVFLLIIGAVVFFVMRSRNNDSSAGTTSTASTAKPVKTEVESRDDSWLHEGNFSSDVVRGEPDTPREEPIKPGTNIVGACPNCGGDIEEGWTSCQYCGTGL